MAAHRWCWLAALIAISPLWHAFAGEIDPEVPPLQMSLEMEKDAFLVREPIYVKVEFKNNTDQAVYFPDPAFYGELKLEIVREDGTAIPFGLRLRESGSPSHQKVEASGSLHYTFELLSRSPYLRKGQYALKARFTPKPGHIERLRHKGAAFAPAPSSLERAFTVESPAPVRENIMAADWVRWKDPSQPMLVDENVAAGPAILVLHPNTVYARHARYWFGRICERRRAFSSAVQMYREQLRLFPDYPLRDEIEYRALRLEFITRRDDRLAAHEKLKKLIARTQDMYVLEDARSILLGQELELKREH